MNFWNTSDGANAAVDAQDEFEMPGGNMDPIPDGSSVLALIDEAKWDKREIMGEPDADYISLRWSVLEPEGFRNRKVFQKLWVTDDDPNADNAEKAQKKRDRAKQMLASIDKNAEGQLARQLEMPTDATLGACLTNKPMVIKCMVWTVTDKQTGERIEGNWIAAVAPASKPPDVKAAKPKPPAVKFDNSALDDEIPF